MTTATDTKTYLERMDVQALRQQKAPGANSTGAFCREGRLVPKQILH